MILVDYSENKPPILFISLVEICDLNMRTWFKCYREKIPVWLIQIMISCETVTRLAPTVTCCMRDSNVPAWIGYFMWEVIAYKKKIMCSWLGDCMTDSILWSQIESGVFFYGKFILTHFSVNCYFAFRFSSRPPGDYEIDRNNSENDLW